MTITRNEYMNNQIDHHTYYCHLIDTIGRKAVEGLVLRVASTGRLASALKEDEHLNNIPLPNWDVMDSSVRSLIANSRDISARVMAITWPNIDKPAGKFYWSLSDTVCLLKSAARRMVEELAMVAP